MFDFERRMNTRCGPKCSDTGPYARNRGVRYHELYLSGTAAVPPRTHSPVLNGDLPGVIALKDGSRRSRTGSRNSRLPVRCRALIRSALGGHQYRRSNGRRAKSSMRDNWQEPWGDRRQEIVFIGSEIEWPTLRARLDACLLPASIAKLKRRPAGPSRMASC